MSQIKRRDCVNREIKKRKSRFWAFCLALVFAFMQVTPIDVLAATCTVTSPGNNDVFSWDVSMVKGGDTIQYPASAYPTLKSEFIYYSTDGTVVYTDTQAVATNHGEIKSYTVLDCTDVTGIGIMPEKFKGWTVGTITGSSGVVYSIKLMATAYMESSINYVLGEGEVVNSDLNPATYMEGKENTALYPAQKDNYTFDGWYLDAAFTDGPYTTVDTTWTGEKSLYAKFSPNTYAIEYELNGGTNGEGNPSEYTYGTGVTQFKDASKTGCTFGGWYSDSLFTDGNKVTSISAEQSGVVKLYAKFTPNTYAIEYEVNGGTNGEGNPSEYTYGTGVTKFKDASKTGYTFNGWFGDANFTTQVTSISNNQVGTVNLFAKYSFIKKKGEGSISVEDVIYGKSPVPLVGCPTEQINQVNIEYKLKNASDATYTTAKPTKVGQYTARATFAETQTYEKLTVTDDFSIQYLTAPQSPYRMDGTEGENGYYKSSVTIYPAQGYLIADSLDGNYKDKLVITKSAAGMSTYLKKISTGEKTAGISVPEIKIDAVSPIVKNASAGEIIYGDEKEVIIEDENLVKVFVNGISTKCENGQAVLSLSANNGEETYEIIGIDNAGNKVTMNIVVAEEWMKTKQIPTGVMVKLYSKYTYKLGSGSWHVSGDSTTYSGNSSICVNADGEYMFSN